MAVKAGEPYIPLTLQRSRLKAEEKTLDFEFEVVSAQFNRRGRYALQLTVENPLLQGSGAGVRLRINSGDIIQSSTGTTDTIEQSDLNQIYSFQRRKFTFTLPRGFCKNDRNHDVRLRIEALHFPGRAERMRMSRQVGEAFFAIYPRTNQPRMKLSAGRDEDWYRYSAVMALLRVGSEQPAMHCGRLAFTASLHEHRPPTVLTLAPTLPSSTQEEDQQALPGDSADEHLSSSFSSSSVPEQPATPHLDISPACCQQVSKSPAGSEEPRHAQVAGGGHMAHVGKEAITVTLHGASNLPTTRDGQVPWPYVTSRGAKQKLEATHASSVPTHTPTWEEEVTVEMDAEDAGWAGESIRGLWGQGCRGLGHGSHLIAGLILGYYRTCAPKHPKQHPGRGWPWTSRALSGCGAGPPEQPTWDTSFLFQGQDVATIFSEDTALAIEYYPYKASPGLPCPQPASGGMRVDGLAVPLPLPPQRPTTFLTPSGSDALPSLDPTTTDTLQRGEELQAAPLHPFYCQEVSSYRQAMKRMVGDLLSLRHHVTSLEVENGHLRRNLASQEELATLKHKLVASTAEMRRLKNRVQQLQNELIRKNDREKDLVLLQRAHRQQQATLRKCQEKVAKTKGLEETVRQQEKVRHIPVAPPPHPTGEALSREVYTTLLAKDCRLREELARPPLSLPPITPRPPVLPVRPGRGTQGWDGKAEPWHPRKWGNVALPFPTPAHLVAPQTVFGGAEKQVGITPRTPLDGGERGVLGRGRGHLWPPHLGESQPGLGLSQLEEAARRWGREKQELGTRLLEWEHGFPHTSTSVSTWGGTGATPHGGWQLVFAVRGKEWGSEPPLCTQAAGVWEIAGGLHAHPRIRGDLPQDLGKREQGGWSLGPQEPL
uniref:Coiled-coil domain containing 33 n=1 Tax=Otus sunia TaxID=257818 RepID=A0A8C8AV98_9STRI